MKIRSEFVTKIKAIETRGEFREYYSLDELRAKIERQDTLKVPLAVKKKSC